MHAYSAVVKIGVWPVGGDTRYTVRADGRSIVATRQLYKRILEPPPPEARKPVMGYHVLLLSRATCAPTTGREYVHVVAMFGTALNTLIAEFMVLSHRLNCIFVIA